MAKVSPFHTTESETPAVYHDDDTCKYGKNIAKENKAAGTGGRKKCSECASTD